MPRYSACLWLAALLLLGPLAGGCPAQGPGLPLDHYSNAKYGFAVGYPPGVFVPQGESDSGDGQVFLSPDGRAELRVYAAFNVLAETLAHQFAATLDTPGLQPTYQVRHGDWFVVSGLLEGKVFYRKTRLAKDVFYTVMLTYDSAAKAAYDPLVAAIVKSFVIF